MSKDEISEDSLWDNPMVNAARAAMSPEQIAEYEKQGEYMFSHNFEMTQSLTTMPESSLEALSYIRESLKSGQHPSTLEQSEKDLLLDAHGDGWLAEFGYMKEDLNTIVTLTK